MLSELKNKYDKITQDITADGVKSGMGLIVEKLTEKYYGYIGDIDTAIKYTKEAIDNDIIKLRKKRRSTIFWIK